jgi:hypothetical protein
MNGAFPVALRAPYNAPFIASNKIPLRSCFGSLRLHLKLTFAARFTPIPTAVHGFGTRPVADLQAPMKWGDQVAGYSPRPEIRKLLRTTKAALSET